mmetsp:Transcript_4177/g.12972  ORF Transcript_4177/g.12972 Transcript_4177/m.12972 type:complete len:212 (-) Transcript_4177:1095-1730(-)
MDLTTWMGCSWWWSWWMWWTSPWRSSRTVTLCTGATTWSLTTMAGSLCSSSSSSWTGTGVATATATGAAAASTSFCLRRRRRRMRRQSRGFSSPLGDASSTRPLVASSGRSPSKRREAPLATLPTVAAAILSVMVAPALVKPPTMPGWGFMRLASSLALTAAVTAPTTLSVGHGDLGWLAGGQDAPVTMVVYLKRSWDFSLSRTLSDWSFS